MSKQNAIVEGTNFKFDGKTFSVRYLYSDGGFEASVADDVTGAAKRGRPQEFSADMAQLLSEAGRFTDELRIVREQMQREAAEQKEAELAAKREAREAKAEQRRIEKEAKRAEARAKREAKRAERKTTSLKGKGKSEPETETETTRVDVPNFEGMTVAELISAYQTNYGTKPPKKERRKAHLVEHLTALAVEKMEAGYELPWN